MSSHEIINCLKLKLHSATSRNVKNGKVEHSLRNLERSLTEDISSIRAECDVLSQQIQDMRDKMSATTNQISTIEICSVSETSQIEHTLLDINAHKQGFDLLFAKERNMAELHDKDFKEKIKAEEDIERQKIAKILETNEQKGKEAAAIERECDAIERDCIVLTKRNKAIMLKLRRRLVDVENSRRELMRKNGLLNLE